MAHDRKDEGPSKVSDILTAILKDRGWNSVLRQNRVFELWGTAVGEHIARHSRPIRVNRGVLVVAVSSPVWTQELTLRKETIIDRLNEHLGESTILDIRFIQGEISDG